MHNEQRKCSNRHLLIHVTGKHASYRHNGFIWKENEDKSIIQTIITKFDEDHTKKSNIIAERCQFLKRKQEMCETCDQFVMGLRSLIFTCEYINPDEVLRDQFILQIRDKKDQRETT